MAKKSKGTKFTKEQIEKAMRCKDADELLALAKSELYDMTRDEAEASMAEIQDIELDEEMLKKAAGGGCYPDCKNDYCFEN